MKSQKAAIYCRVDDDKEYASQQEKLDKMYFRLASFAHAHEMSIVSYYEDIANVSAALPLSGITDLLDDYNSGLFKAILVTNYNQLPKGILVAMLESIYSVNTSERIHKALH